jgi:hypothetical protein
MTFVAGAAGRGTNFGLGYGNPLIGIDNIYNSHTIRVNHIL